MKKIYSFLVLLFAFSTLVAQENQNSGSIVASEFHVTRPIREIFAENPVDENYIHIKGESKDKKHRKAQSFPLTIKDGPQFGNDTNTIQQAMGTVPPLPLKANWAGQTASGFRPYDPSGAVGPNHYIQMINSTTFRIYNKATGTTALTGTLGNLWSPATPNAGDPIVMYDKPADRWFLAQFGSGNQIYIAVSQTNDPTGAYYTYTYISPAFPDYLKFSVWTDGYYMTSNQSPQKVFAFNRAEILAGTPGARSVYTNFSPPSSGFFCPLPGDAADGVLPPVGTPCPIVSYSDNGWGAGFSDAVNIYNMSVNWVPTTPTATITLAANVPTAVFDGFYESSWNNCVQPGTTQKLDAIGGVCMYRAQWKTWSGYNTMVLNWSVRISTTQRSIKWCEMRQNQTTGVWSIYQEGIYAPDAATRWMGSMAMDNNGSIGLSYIKSDATSIYPGLYYTGRRACDPLGTLPVTEALVVAGTGSQTGTNRVGDYAHTTLDVDGVTFWSTSEYMGGSTGGSAARTQIFSYQILPCSNTAAVSILQTSGTNPQCAGASATFTATPVNGGTTPSYQWKVNGSNVGTNSPTFTSTTLSTGQIVTCVMTSNLAGVIGSPATSNAITMTVNPILTPSVSIVQSSGTNPSCAGSSVSFSATPINGGTPSYQWKVNGVNAGINSAAFTTSALTNGQIVTCVMTSSAQCASPTTATSNAITMTINPIVSPAVSIAITSGSNPSCLGSSVSFSATPINGGTTPSYQWKVNGVNAGTNSASFTSSTLTNGQVVTCVLTSNATCASPTTATSNGITMVMNTTVVPSVSISITSGSNPSCAGSNITFTASPINGGTPSYQWKVNGANVGTNSPTYSSTTLTNTQVVSCVMTSSSTCASPLTATSNSITMTINPTVTPSVTIGISGGTNPSCSGNSVAFLATATNGGTPSYQWKINGVNVGTNNATYSSSSITNGQVITCVITSTATCASPSTATSNSITMTINPLPIVTASNANGCLGVPILLSGSPTGGSFSVANPYTGPSTTFTYSYTNGFGCTAISSPKNITVSSPSINSPQTVSACDAYTWIVNNTTYTTSGIKTANFTNQNGCDSTYSLNLTIYPSTSSSSTVSSLNSYLWSANGITYTNSGVYTHTILNANGCDSVLTLNLTINTANPGILLSPKVLLAGPYSTSTGLMHDSLRINNLIPTIEPYSGSPLNLPQISYVGGESVSPSILAVTGNNAIVDWVFLELRSATTPTVLIATKRALLQRDGDVVSHTDGVSPVSFQNQFPGNYYVSIKHRNHLGVMTASALSLSAVTTQVNFSNSDPVWVNPLIINAPRKVNGNLRLLFCGDANANKTIKYNGSSNDKDPILLTVGVATPNNITIGYRTEDLNLDSKVKYNNADNDRGVLLNSVGANTPNTILFQHTPN